MNSSEAMEIIKELVKKFLDVDQSQLTSSDRMKVVTVLEDLENIVLTFQD